MVNVTINREIRDILLPFPKVMERTQDNVTVLVFFWKPGYGTILKTTQSDIGAIYTDWNMKGFEDFMGSITISNETF